MSVGISTNSPPDIRDLERPTRRLPWMQGGVLHRVIAENTLIRRFCFSALSRAELAFLGGHKEAGTIALIKGIRRERESLLGGNEAYMLYSLARMMDRAGGAMAEVGVYQGCSAKLIRMAAPNSELHLFDTFAGLPQPNESECARLRRGNFAASLGAVKDYLKGLPDIVYHPGLFPGPNTISEEKKFSFIHLDVDLRESTLESLQFFYDRLLPGGIVITHDYSYHEGVRKAFADFLFEKPENLIELPTSQAMFVRTQGHV